jgi:hypothetical protein
MVLEWWGVLLAVVGGLVGVFAVLSAIFQP